MRPTSADRARCALIGMVARGARSSAISDAVGRLHETETLVEVRSEPPGGVVIRCRRSRTLVTGGEAKKVSPSGQADPYEDRSQTDPAAADRMIDFMVDTNPVVQRQDGFVTTLLRRLEDVMNRPE